MGGSSCRRFLEVSFIAVILIGASVFIINDDDTAQLVTSNVTPTSLPRPEGIVKAIAEGMYNTQIANLTQQLKLSHQQRIKRNPGNQYLIAVPLAIGPDSSISGSPDGAMYYQNMNLIGLQNSSDIDNKSIQCIENIQTKFKSESKLKDTGKKTLIHTELQFLCGKHFREALRSENAIFLVYSHYIPCSGLSSCSYGECAGDMAYHRHMNNKVHFIVPYAKLFEPGGEGTGSNEKLSKLYLTLAGIPLLKCQESCELTPVDKALPLGKLIKNPFFHRFPRVCRNDRTKAIIFAECLARGTFIQELSNSNPPLHDVPQSLTDQIMTEFAKEYLLERCQDKDTTKCNYDDFLKHHAVEMRNHTNSSMMKLNLHMCLLYMDVVPSNYPDSELELDRSLKKQLDKTDQSRKIRDKFCESFGIKVLSKGKIPHICPKKYQNDNNGSRIP